MAPPKKKPGKPGEADADLFDEFLRRYAKNQKEFDTPKLVEAHENIAKLQDEGEEVLSWNFSREFDSMAFRVLFQSFLQSNYNKIKAVRVWRCKGGDESVRNVCLYLENVSQPEVEDLQFCDNGVTSLGCEFLGRTLGPGLSNKVSLLRLDYNQFGTAGMEKLSVGLSQNETIRHLSLQYCNIGEDGGIHVAYAIMFIRSALEKLELRGNYLQNKGIIEVLRGARRSKTLKEIDVFDNKFTDTTEFIEIMRELFFNNTNLVSYNFQGNPLSDAGAMSLVQAMIGNLHLKEFKLPERCSEKTFQALENQLSQGRGKKRSKRKTK